VIYGRIESSGGREVMKLEILWDTVSSQRGEEEGAVRY
jgi:hypothetical protein